MNTLSKSIEPMIQSAMQMEKVFFENIYDLVNIMFTASEIQQLKDIQAALSPLHVFIKKVPFPHISWCEKSV